MMMMPIQLTVTVSPHNPGPHGSPSSSDRRRSAGRAHFHHAPRGERSGLSVNSNCRTSAGDWWNGMCLAPILLLVACRFSSVWRRASRADDVDAGMRRSYIACYVPRMPSSTPDCMMLMRGGKVRRALMMNHLRIFVQWGSGVGAHRVGAKKCRPAVYSGDTGQTPRLSEAGAASHCGRADLCCSAHSDRVQGTSGRGAFQVALFARSAGTGAVSAFWAKSDREAAAKK